MNSRSLAVFRAVWVAATAALALAWRGEALTLLVPLAVLGPLLKEAVPFEDVDERQRLADYRASHVALMVAYLLIFVLFARLALVEGKEVPPELWLLLAVPLLVRVVLSVGKASGARRTGLVLGFGFGGAWVAFTLLSHGPSWEALGEAAVGGSVLAATAVARKAPRVGGGLLVAVGLAFLALFVRVPAGRGEWSSGLFLGATLALPPLIAGVALAGSGQRAASEAGKDEFEDLRSAPAEGKEEGR